jgi:hypothetical protein
MRAGRHRGLPRTVRPQHAPFVPAGRIDDFDGQRIAAVKMPDFIGREPVKRGKIVAGEQKYNRRERAARRPA